MGLLEVTRPPKWQARLDLTPLPRYISAAHLPQRGEPPIGPPVPGPSSPDPDPETGLQLLDYAPIAVLALLALVVSGAIILLSFVAGRPRHSTTAMTPYECGVPTFGNARERFSVKFYLVAVLFILFDIEIVFLYPWAVAFDQLGLMAIIEMFLFIALLLVGYVYVWKKGALEWD